jgi:chromosome segregation ATPase
MIENYNKSLADLQRLNTTISRLETEVERLRKTPVTSDKELVELRAQRDALLLERDQLRTELKNMIDPSQHQKLEAELADKNNQIANLNREIESLRKDLQASQQLNQRVRELEASLANQSKLQQEIELLRRTIAEITKDRDENLKKLMIP